MADTAVDTTATAEVTAKVRFIHLFLPLSFFSRLNRRVERFRKLVQVVTVFMFL